MRCIKENYADQNMFSIHWLLVNPLGPKSDQHQFSPNNISRSSKIKVMGITKLMTKGRML